MRMQRLALASCTLALVAGCGGGDDQPLGAESQGTAREGALATTSTATITPAMVFDFAQRDFKSLFPAASGPDFTILFEGKNFDVRGFVGGNFLGVANGEIWGLGPFTGGSLTYIGKVSDYACLILPASCAPPPPPPGALNECTAPASTALVAGNRFKGTYVYIGPTTGEQAVETVVDGDGFTFEGQSAIQVTSTTSSQLTTTLQSGKTTSTLSTAGKAYLQAGIGGLTRTLGGLSDFTEASSTDLGIPGTPPFDMSSSGKTKIVYSPPDQNVEYTIQPGRSIDNTVSFTLTTLATSVPPLPPPFSNTGTTRHTFVAKETLTLSNGKSYSACKYTAGLIGNANVTTRWVLVGNGLVLKTLDTVDNKPQTSELKSGTLNGVPL